MSEPEFNPTSEQLDRWYELHCEFMQASRATMIRFSTSESDKNLLRQQTDISRKEFERTLRAMTPEVRTAYLTDIEEGYEAAAARTRKSPLFRAIIDAATKPPSGGRGQ
jgi:hypothetical protein